MLQHRDPTIVIRREAAEDVGILRADHLTFRVWSMLMLGADHEGIWRGSLDVLALVCNADPAEVRSSLDALSSSDFGSGPYVADYGGDGETGWALLCGEDGRRVRSPGQLAAMRRARRARAAKRGEGCSE